MGPSRLLVQKKRHIRVWSEGELKHVQVTISLDSSISLSLAQGQKTIAWGCVRKCEILSAALSV